MDDRYVAHEVSDWLARLHAGAARHDGTRLDRADLIEEIGESFAHLMSTGPDYSRVVTGHVQDAVRAFSRGDGDQADEALGRARDAVPGQAGGPAPGGR
jgi:hypothetical protein